MTPGDLFCFSGKGLNLKLLTCVQFERLIGETSQYVGSSVLTKIIHCFVPPGFMINVPSKHSKV